MCWFTIQMKQHVFYVMCMHVSVMLENWCQIDRSLHKKDKLRAQSQWTLVVSTFLTKTDRAIH